MATFVAKVSFHDVPESAVEAVLTIAEGHMSIEAAGRQVGRWPIRDLSPRLSGASVEVSAEGERLVIDVTDPDALRVSLGVPGQSTEGPSPAESHRGERASARHQGRHDRPSPNGRFDGARMPPGPAADTEDPVDLTAESRPPSEAALRDEIRGLDAELATAQEQLRWVQDLVPRRLPIPLREHESGLGVVQGVRLKERRPLPESNGRQPWVVVDSGNVYVTDRRLVFSGTTDVDFAFGDINKKGASQTGLLLGVSSRTQAHILAGPGERLAVVLTAAEKIANGIDPSLPFREAISRLTSKRADLQRRLESARGSTVDSEASDRSHTKV